MTTKSGPYQPINYLGNTKMAKKKKPVKDTNLLEVSKALTKELEGKLSAAKELLDDKDKEIADLLQRIDSDKGIPPSTDAELIGAKKAAAKLKDVNGALKDENIKLKAKLKGMIAAAPTQAPAMTSASAHLVAACLGNINLSIPTPRFINGVKLLVDNAIIVAEAIQARHCDDPCEDEE